MIQRFGAIHSTEPGAVLQLKQRRNYRNGQAIILITLSLSFMMGVIGLSVDLGWAYYLKMRVQTAADAAATAAAAYARNNSASCSTETCSVEYTCVGTTPPTSATQAGCLYATQDGPPSMTAKMVANDSTTSTGVSGNTPSMWFKATVSTSANNMFFYSSAFRSASITAQSIAGVSVTPPPSCIYVLNATASQALSVTGSGALALTGGCGVYVNSNASNALNVSGGGTLTSTNPGGTPGAIRVVGLASGNATTPAAITGSPRITDPLASLVAPTFSDCDFGTATTPINYSNGTHNLSPGVYCNGITLSGGTVTLDPGIYILNGNGLTVSSSTNFSGSKVMFYNTATSGHTAKPVTISGQATVTLSAPTSGTYRGMVFFQDRNVSYTTDNTFSGGTGASISGTLYFKTTGVTISGGSGTQTNYASYVTDTLTISGNSSLRSDNTGTHTATVTATPSLIQ